MILRHSICRHGRTALSSSTKRAQPRRYYADSTNIDNPMHRQSESDHQPIRSIPGHPDEPSSLLDAIGHTSTPNTEPLEAAIESSSQDLSSLRGQVLSAVAAQNAGAIPVQKSFADLQAELPPSPHTDLTSMYAARQAQRDLTNPGSDLDSPYHPSTLTHNPPHPSEVTLPSLLANQCHLGHATALWHPGNSSYIFGIRHKIHIISLEITLSYLRRAAKIVHEVARRGGIILFVGTRKGTRDIVVTSAKRASAYHIFSRWIPGSLTNGQQILEKAAVKIVNAQDEELTAYKLPLRESSHPVMRPDLVVCLNPLENEVCLHECGIYNIPTVGIIDTDVNPAWVTYPIPANDDSLRSVALISGALSRAAEEGQKSRRGAAEQGRMTYPTRKVDMFLMSVGEVQGFGDVQGRGGGGDEKGRQGRGRGRGGSED